MTGRAAALIVAIGFVVAVSIYVMRQAQWQIENQERMLREARAVRLVDDPTTRDMEESLGTERLMAVLGSMGTVALIIILVVLLCREIKKDWVIGKRYVRELDMEDIFRPRTDPARTIYDTLQVEAEKRTLASIAWIESERQTVWRAARDYAQQHRMRVPTLEEVECAEKRAIGHVDYGARWAYGVAELMRRV